MKKTRTLSGRPALPERRAPERHSHQRRVRQRPLGTGTMPPMASLSHLQPPDMLFRLQADWYTLQVRTLGWPPAARMSALVSASFAAARQRALSRGLSEERRMGDEGSTSAGGRHAEKRA
jgi:hypothetical protein